MTIVDEGVVTMDNIHEKLSEGSLMGNVFLGVVKDSHGFCLLEYILKGSPIKFRSPIVVKAVIQGRNFGATGGFFCVSGDFERLLEEKAFVDFVESGAVTWLSQESPPLKVQGRRYCSQ